MQNLNPTLWRTCRMLAGATRIRLLRELQSRPGQSVSELARAAGIGLSDASQELRRIQSRGLLRADRRGVALVYRMEPDPQVGSAAPILKILRPALASGNGGLDERIVALARGLAHPKRLAIVKLLMHSPKSAYALHRELQSNFANIQRHLNTLVAGGYVRREGHLCHFTLPGQPLAKVLLKFLPD